MQSPLKPNSHATGAADPGIAHASPARFLVLAAAWSVGLFALLRAPWFITYAALPFTEMQAAIARWYGGGATPAVAGASASRRRRRPV